MTGETTEFLYLNTRGRRSGEPREIEIWFTERGGCYYVIAEHGASAHWVQNPDREYHAGMTDRVILVTGFEPFGPHAVNPSEALAKAMDGRRFGPCVARSAILPVHHAQARPRVEGLVAELAPESIVHLGLANGRARLALERVAVNVMDYPIPDNAGRRVVNEPCVPEGPAAYLSTLPLAAILAALLAEGIPAFISNTAGTYLCNQTLYGTLHALASRSAQDDPRVSRAGFIHVPSLPAMVAASGLDEPSADLPLMLRAVETVLEVVAREQRSGD